MTNLYFVRHGKSEANVLREFSNVGTKHPLTDEGRRQMEELGKDLVGTSALRILASPLLRAVESAEILARTLRLPYAVDPRLIEYSVGRHEGRRDDEAWADYFAVRAAWAAGDHQAAVADGESLHDIHERFMPLLRQLAGEVDTIAVSHGGTLCTMLPLACENLDPGYGEEHPLEATDVVHLRSRGLQWHCVSWAGTTIS